MSNIINGNSLMLFIKENENYSAIAYAKSHELEISSDTEEVHSRLHDEWTDFILTSGSWSITCECLYTEDSSKMFDLFKNRHQIVCMFGLASNYDENGIVDTENSWAIANGYRGKAYITSLDINAETSEAATMNITLEGTSPIRKVNVQDEEDYVEPALPSLEEPGIAFTNSEAEPEPNSDGTYRLSDFTELLNPNGLPVRFIVDRYDGRLSD